MSSFRWLNLFSILGFIGIPLLLAERVGQVDVDLSPDAGASDVAEVAFEANLGQADTPIGFLARGSAYRLLLSPVDATWHFPGSGPLRMSFVGADPSSAVLGLDSLPGRVHYLVGRRADDWIQHVPTYRGVFLEGLYPGVDLTYRGSGRQIALEFSVAPGADPDGITVDLEGFESFDLDPDGNLIVLTTGGAFRQVHPTASQRIEGETVEVESRWTLLETGGVGLALGEYDSAETLIVRSVSDTSAIAGTGVAMTEVDVAVNDVGDALITGHLGGWWSSPNPRPFELADAFLIRWSPDDAMILDAVYFGGSGEDVPHDVALGPDGSVIIAGRTDSTDFPVAHAAQSELAGAADAFVIRLAPTVVDPIHSTLLGGTGTDSGRGIAVDASGNLWLVGKTDSPDFPTTASTERPAPAGGADGFVARLSVDGSAVTHVELIGGIGEDSVEAIAVGSAGRVFVTGTWSSNTFVAELDPHDGTWVLQTLLGGSAGDGGSGIAIDASGDVYVTGWTRSTDFPTTAQAIQSLPGGSVDGFVARISGSDGSIVDATYLGGEGDDRIFEIVAGPEGSPWLVGATDSPELPLGGAARHELLRFDGFTARLDAGALMPVRALYLGGEDDDLARALALDRSGRAIVVGTSHSPAAPLHRIESTAMSGDVFVSVVFATEQNAGCPGTVNFDNDSADGLWQTASNWDTDSLPGASDDVCIGAFDVTLSSGTQTVQSLTVEATGSLTVSGGTLDLASASQIDGTFTLGGGTLSGNGDLTTTGTFDWTGGQQSGTGTTHVQGALNITGSFVNLTRTLNSAGTTTYNATSSGLRIGNDGVFNNLAGATFDAQNDTNLTYLGGSAAFNNDGDFIKSGGAGTTILTSGITFTNDGSVDVQSGTLELRVTATHTGSFDCTGTTLSFNGGTHDLSAAETLTGTNVIFGSGTVNVPGGYDVTGTTTVTGGTANFTGSITDTGALSMDAGTLNLSHTEASITQSSFTMSGGTLTGTSAFDVTGAFTQSGGTVSLDGDLTVGGVFEWTAGTQSGIGVTDAQGGIDLTGSFVNLSRTLNSAGTTTYNATSSGLRIGNDGVFNNLVGATFDAQNDTNVTFLGGSSAFNNDGAFIKSGGSGTTILTGGVTFTNDGSVDVQSGTLELRTSATHTGSFDCTGATLSFNGGTHDLSAAGTLTGTNVIFDSGTVNLAGGYDVSGTTTVTGSTANWTGSISDIGTLVVDSGTANFSHTEALITQPSFSLAAGTVTGTSDFDITGGFSQSGGSITLAGDLTIGGTYDWTGGTLGGAGTTEAQAGINITGGIVTLQRTLNNVGTTVYNATSSGLQMGSGGVFNNLPGATFDAQNDTNLTFGGGSPVFLNEGAFVKSGGSGTTVLSSGIVFTNDGSVQVQSGTLELNVGATHAGSFDSTGGTLSFDGGTHDLSAAQTVTGTNVLFDSGTVNLPGGYNVTGTTTVAGGTANFTGSITDVGTLSISSGTANLSNSEGVVNQATFTMAAGVLTGSSDLTVAGPMVWTGGDLTGTGAVNPLGGLSITGGVVDLFRTINNSATTVYNATSSGLRMGSGAVFNNLPGATFDAQNDTNLTFGGGSPVFINDGTFVKSGGDGTTTLPGGIAFANDGAVDVQSGTLELSVGATHTGSFDCTGGTLSFNGGTHDLSAAETLTGTHVLIDSGTVNLPGDYDVSGSTTVAGGTANFTGAVSGMGDLILSTGILDLSLAGGSVSVPTFEQTGGTFRGSTDLDVGGAATWSAGTQSGTGETTFLGTLDLSGTSSTLLSRTMNNFGNATLSGTGNFRTTTDGIFNNMAGATFDVQTDADITREAGAPEFNNAGTFKKSAGVATTSVANLIAFNNSGAVEALSGTLTITTFSQTAGSTTVNGGLLTSPNTLPFLGGSLNGVGTVTAPMIDSSGTVAPGLSTGTLAIDGDYTQQVGGTFSVELDGVGCTGNDLLDVTGTAMLGGALDVTLTDGCQPVPGQSFTLITAGSVMGSFSFTPPPTNCPVDWNVVYNAGSVVLEILTGTCLDSDGDTFSDCCGTCNPDVGDSCTDCDDNDPVSFPGAPELCDGTDNDCDTVLPVDEIDDDGDLFVECTGWNDTQGDAPTILGGDDCDDADVTSFPGAPELCDGNDNDCDTVVPSDEIDNDGDLYVECAGWNDTQGDQLPILGGDDCDDDDANSFPTAPELCDGNDNDCDSTIAGSETDDDGDLYVECSGWSDTQNDQPAILGGDDCDDVDANSFPTAPELCDGNDNDCDTVVPADELDGDGDFYVECVVWNDTQGDDPSILGGNDCAPADPLINPDALEVCDGVDNDCSGVEDDGDADEDGFLVCADCNDGNADVHAIPSVALDLRFLSATDLQWDAPASPGGSAVDYDTIRSVDPTDFVAGAVCVESDDGEDTAAADPDVPATGVVFHYLVRAENVCGGGSVGQDSEGQERSAGPCP